MTIASRAGTQRAECKPGLVSSGLHPKPKALTISFEDVGKMRLYKAAASRSDQGNSVLKSRQYWITGLVEVAAVIMMVQLVVITAACMSGEQIVIRTVINT